MKIKGAHLNNAIKVTVNGVEAVIVADFGTLLKIKVPAGATTGLIKVKTLVGTAKSATAFTVTGMAATASANPASGNAPLTVSFTGTATGGTPPYSYSWNFGDGSATSTAQNPAHIYTTDGTFTATLTVTDSSSPAKMATSSVTITVSPISVPTAPRHLTATAGNGTIKLEWEAPSSDGGEAVTSYEVFRGTSSGTETYLTSGGCSNLGDVLTCTDTGLTNGTTYYYYVIAVNSIGSGPQSNEASATPTGTSGP